MAANLTSGELSECKEVFSLFDRDGDGTIDVDELGAALSFLGLNLSEDNLEEMMEQIDADKSGAIDFDEFLAVLNTNNAAKDSPTSAGSPEEQARKQQEESEAEDQLIFNMIDKDSDHVISIEDLATVLSECMPNEMVTEEDLTRMIKLLDNPVDVVDFQLYRQIQRKASS